MAQRYDHRHRNAVVRSEDINPFVHLNIPKSNKIAWLREGPASVMTTPEFDLSRDELLFQTDKLKRELALYLSKSDLISTPVNVLGLQLHFKRVPSAEIRTKNIHAIKHASVRIVLDASLDLVKLGKARFSS